MILVPFLFAVLLALAATSAGFSYDSSTMAFPCKCSSGKKYCSGHLADAVPADVDDANGVTDVGNHNLVTFQFQVPIINYLAFGQALEHLEMLH